MNTGNRHTTRIPGHDYSGWADYFVTLCTENRECLFGNVIEGQMYLNALGQIVREEWLRSPQIRTELDMDRWIVMPNHLHGIVRFTPEHAPRARTSGSLGSFIAGFKSITTKRINEMRGTPGAPVWQRNYNEHIIDNNEELERIRRYIEDNPKHWNSE